jgi:hypothetical protein
VAEAYGMAAQGSLTQELAQLAQNRHLTAGESIG